MQSLVPSLSLNNLIPLITFFSVVFVSLDKTIPLRIDKNRTPPDWQKQAPSGLAKWDPSGLVKTGPLRIGKNRTPPDWQNWTLRIGKIGTHPDGDPSGFVKIASRGLFQFSLETLPDTFSDAIMLSELTRKGVSSFLRPFRIEAKPLI